MDIVSSSSIIVFAIGILFFISVLANKISDRFGVPMLLMFLAVGMLAGSEGIGRITFDNPAAANFIGIFALAYILFSGGLDTSWTLIKPILRPGLTLATGGVILTAAITGLFAWWILGDLFEGMLIGAIVSSTDAAAVFSIMRSRGVSLKGSLKPLLELESGSNDPMAVLLTTSVLSLLGVNGATWYELLGSVVVRMALGVVLGYFFGRAAAWIFNRTRLEYEGLYPVLSMSLVLITYSLTDMLFGNGFLAVYTCGIVLGNKDFLFKHYLKKFHDGLGWLMQIILFVTLGMLVVPSQLLGTVAKDGLLIAVALMFVARPAAVYIGLWKSKFTLPECTLTAWTGLRGSVPIVLATFPFTAGYENSTEIFNIVFFIVIASVLLQGKTLMVVARWLNVDKPLVNRPDYPLEFERRAGVKSETREIDIPPDSCACGKQIMDLGLPAGALILLIRRGNEFIVPKGSTRIEAYDTLMFIAGVEDLKIAQELLLTAAEDVDEAVEGDEQQQNNA
ncbi:MAG: potassium/proton antiporter [Kiritimatiellales bacterium]